MKRFYILALLLMAWAGSLLAQSGPKISVASFTPLVGDMTTTSQEGKRLDQNNEVAALIKIVTSETGFTFEAGALGVVDSQQRNGEIWVWVPRGSRKITILHQQLGVLRDYRYPVEIEADRTYEMVLTTAKIETIIKEEVHEQFLIFQLTPPNAVLFVNDEPWSVSPEGRASKLLEFGTYTYRVEAPNYHPDAGKLTVNDPNNEQRKTITLRPNFGWIEVSGGDAVKGAKVYIDNALVGTAPYRSDGLKSGKHSVMVMRDLYAPYNETVTVKDNETTQVTPILSADFANITLQVDADAEIWVNGVKKGTRSWIGPLGSGTYKIECKQENHEPTSKKIEITNRMNGEVIQLDTPVPICGSLVIESTPDMATVYIDGKNMGQTPKLIKEIIIGRHEVRITKKDYFDYSETVTVSKDYRSTVNAVLSTYNKEEFNRYMNLAESALNANNFDEAIRNYQLAYDVYQDSSIPSKISSAQYKKEQEMQRIEEMQAKETKRKNASRKASSIFWGNENNHTNFGGFHLTGGGAFIPSNNENIWLYQAGLYYANLRTIPFYLDFNFKGGDYYMFDLGAGLYMTFNDYFALNYGGGYRWIDGDGTAFLKFGVTCMFERYGWGGINYSFEPNIGSKGYPACHSITYIFGSDTSLYIGAVLLLLALAGLGYSAAM